MAIITVNPGDNMQSALDSATPGDAVLLKAGLHQTAQGWGGDATGIGSLPNKATVMKVNVSGNAANPIVIYGEAGTVIDGSELLSLVDNAGVLEGSFAGHVHSGGSRNQHIEGVFSETSGRILPVQEPAPPDRNNPHDPVNWPVIPTSNYTLTTIDAFALLGSNTITFTGSEKVHLWAGNNNIYTGTCTAYNPGTGILTFTNPPGFGTNDQDPGTDKYALEGFELHFTADPDNDGTYVYDPGAQVIKIRKNGAGDVGPFRASTHGVAIWFGGQSYIHVRDLEFRYFSLHKLFNASSTKTPANERHGILIDNCLFRDGAGGGIQCGNFANSTVSNCISQDLDSRGILLQRGTGLTIDNCFVTRTQGTGIAMFTCDNSVIENCRVIDSLGVHGNGITAYQDSDGITIRQCCVVNSGNALTLQFISNVLVQDVFLDGKNAGPRGIAFWGSSGYSPTNITFERITSIRTDLTLGIYITESVVNPTIKDCILGGAQYNEGSTNPTTSNNVFYELNVPNSQQLQPGETLADKYDIFTDWDNEDFSRKPAYATVGAAHSLCDGGAQPDVTPPSVPQNLSAVEI